MRPGGGHTTQQYLTLIRAAERRLISAATVLETTIVLESGLGEAGGREFDEFVEASEIEIVPVDSEQIEIARRAWRKYGNGRHAVRLNFGDCFAYALARVSGEPLLAKGSDFSQCDLEPAR